MLKPRRLRSILANVFPHHFLIFLWVQGFMKSTERSVRL
jgi:hypothetical protein